MTPYNFDEVIERRDTGSAKWTYYDPDVLPLWVADMDFRGPDAVIRALREKAEHGIYGYEFESPELRAVLVERMYRLYNWDVMPANFSFLPNLVSALNVACKAFAGPGEGVLMQPPVYMPFLSAPGTSERRAVFAPLAYAQRGQELRYEIDFDELEEAITPDVKVFLLCNPHNPVGRVWTRAELERLAEVALRHNLIIVSDEIHCDLLYDGNRHIPIASLSPEVAERCITLMSPSKTFNMPTLHMAFAITQNAELQQQFNKTAEGWLPSASGMGIAAAIAAYREGQEWLDALLAYLKDNRDTVTQYIRQHWPEVNFTQPEGTYLAWLDWRTMGLPVSPYQFFLEKARVALNDGAAFGKPEGEGFVRLNYAAPRATVLDALERMRAAVEDLPG
jgi:cystathionine beta-lyase